MVEEGYHRSIMDALVGDCGRAAEFCNAMTDGEKNGHFLLFAEACTRDGSCLGVDINADGDTLHVLGSTPLGGELDFSTSLTDLCQNFLSELQSFRSDICYEFGANSGPPCGLEHQLEEAQCVFDPSFIPAMHLADAALDAPEPEPAPAYAAFAQPGFDHNAPTLG